MKIKTKTFEELFNDPKVFIKDKTIFRKNEYLEVTKTMQKKILGKTLKVRSLNSIHYQIDHSEQLKRNIPNFFIPDFIIKEIIEEEK